MHTFQHGKSVKGFVHSVDISRRPQNMVDAMDNCSYNAIFDQPGNSCIPSTLRCDPPFAWSLLSTLDNLRSSPFTCQAHPNAVLVFSGIYISNLDLIKNRQKIEAC